MAIVGLSWKATADDCRRWASAGAPLLWSASCDMVHYAWTKSRAWQPEGQSLTQDNRAQVSNAWEALIAVAYSY